MDITILNLDNDQVNFFASILIKYDYKIKKNGLSVEDDYKIKNHDLNVKDDIIDSYLSEIVENNCDFKHKKYFKYLPEILEHNDYLLDDDERTLEYNEIDNTNNPLLKKSIKKRIKLTKNIKKYLKIL